MKLLSMATGAGAALAGVLILSACVGLSAGETAATDKVAAAAGANPPVSLTGAEGFVQCKDPRPEICYEVFSPVCAVRDTGVRCITTPCPSTEQATYGNDCQACSDKRVLGFQPGGECQ